MLFKIFFKLLLLTILFLTLSILFERAKFDVRPLVQINPIPQTQELLQNKQYAKAHEYLTYFMQFKYVNTNEEAIQLLEKISEYRNSLSYQGRKFFEGVIKGVSDETIGNTGAIISDFFLFGDLRDLVIQGKNYFEQKEVDEVIVTLSAIGVIASATTYATAGSSASVKTGISTLKLARRANKFPRWLGRYLKSMLPLIKQSKSIKHIKPIFKQLQTIHKNVGLKDTLTILSKTRRYQALPNVAKITSKYQKKTVPLLELAGKNSINLLHSLQNMPKQTVVYASSFGKAGLQALKQLGFKTFLVRMAKTASKGNLNSFYNYLVKHIPTYILIILSAVIGVFFLIRRKN